MKDDGSIHAMTTQYMNNSKLHGQRMNIIQPDALVKPFSSGDNFNLDFKGELFHIATSGVRFLSSKLQCTNVLKQSMSGETSDFTAKNTRIVIFRSERIEIKSSS